MRMIIKNIILMAEWSRGNYLMPDSMGEILQVIKEKVMSRNILFITLMSIILGCASTGREYNTSAIHYIEVGKTTENDVVSMLGEPISRNMLSNGINIYKYEYGISYLWGTSNSTNTLRVQCYNGVVMNKWQRLNWD
jgi:hypothetical protein